MSIDFVKIAANATNNGVFAIDLARFADGANFGIDNVRHFGIAIIDDELSKTASSRPAIQGLRPWRGMS
jgi:hypothetical protein